MKKYLKLQKHLTSIISNLKSEGTFKNERIITSAQSNIISTTKFSNVLNFCSNNYLGLCDNQEISNEAKKVLDERGFGLSSVRFICGTTDYHLNLEKKISEFYEQEDTILFPSCFDANEAVFEALLTKEDAIITDKLNHASIINGTRLSKAERFLYNNNDMEDLEERLKDSQHSRFRIIVTDGVFSMDGKIAKINQITDLAEKYNAIVMVDECHGTGVLGAKGRGSVEVEKSLHKVELISSTLGKALGGANGGFITGKKEIVSILRQKGRPYLFSNSLPTHCVAAYLKAIDILQNQPELLKKLQFNVELFRSKMTELGFELLGHPKSAICPVLLRDAKLARDFADEMLTKGVYVIGFSYPVVPQDLARIRVQLSACHEEEDILKCVEAFKTVGIKRNII